MADTIFCELKCLASCAPICAADTVSPVADALGFGAGSGTWFR